MLYEYWNTFLLVAPIGLLCLTNGPQPRFHALIMLCTGLLGMHLSRAETPEVWSVGLLVYIILNLITLALSPLQLVLVWCLSPKREIDHGIVVHHEGDEDGNITVDILAVHGLGSNPAWAWTWEDPSTSKKCMWLKDLLPNSLPRARIMAYNHNSAWFRDAPVKSVRICGEQMLEALESHRKLRQEMERPVIFIGHSFGGIIIKQALVAAGEKGNDTSFQSIENSMHGAIFLGVPHDGSRLTSWGMLLSYCTYWLGSSTELLEALQSGAGSLRELNHSFMRSYGERDLVDFFELHKTKTFGLPLLMGVDLHSSTNAGVKRVALEADHIGMNKFNSEKQPNYELVLRQITKMVDKIEKEQSTVLSSEQMECLQSLYLDGSEDRRESIEKPYKSTFQWVDNNSKVRDWMEGKSQIIWVSGKPGCGKSAFSKYLLDRMVQQQKRQKQQGIFNHLQGTSAILSFFFNGQASELLRSERGFLQALLYQLVEQAPLLSSIVPKRKVDYTGKNIPLPLDSLRQTLLLMLSHPKVKSVRLIIDAFDECAEDCKESLLMFVTQDLAKVVRNPAKHPSIVKILITSRRNLELERFLDPYPEIKLEDLNYEDIHVYLTGEFETFTRYHSPEFVGSLVRKAEARSQGVFLWVKLVVKELKKGKILAGTAQELERALDNLPGDLQQFYNLILERLDKSSNAEEWRMLEWVLFAERPLSVPEFRYAISIGSNLPPANLASVEEVTVPLSRMEARIREFSGGFIEVKRRVEPKYTRSEDIDADEFVQFIHQSVKEFLLKAEPNVSGTKLPLIMPPKAHSHLARVCITYLAFPDFNKRNIPIGEAVKIPFLAYAATNWTTHASLAKTYEETAQMTRFEWPKRQNFRVWSELYLYFQSPTYIWEPSEWEDPLLVASRIGLSIDVKHFLRFLGQKYSDERTKTVSRALISAALGGDETTAQLLLREGADANAEEGSALQVAADNGHVRFTQLLLETGADVNASGGSALQLAAYKGHERVIQMLLEKGADVNAEGGDYGGALQAAAWGGQGEVAQLLLEHGVDINASGGGSGDALQIAAREQHLDIIRLLLEQGANVNTGAGAPLQNAAFEGHGKVVQLLLENGADVNIQGGSFGNALQAAARGRHPQIIQLLLETGADINNFGRYFESTLQDAARDGCQKVVQLLLETSADGGIPEESLGNALQAAARTGHANIVQLLLEKGANANIWYKGYGNALEMAAREGHEEVVKLLLKNGVEVNTKGGTYGNALQAAAREGHERVVRVLLDNGADPNTRGGPFGSALKAAIHAHHLNIVQLLLEKGANSSELGDFGDGLAEDGPIVVIQRLRNEL